MAEWLKALVLKTRDGNIRRFESCPFRQFYLAILASSAMTETMLMTASSFTRSFLDSLLSEMLLPNNNLPISLPLLFLVWQYVKCENHLF